MTRQHRIAVQAKFTKEGIASTLNVEDRAEFKENDNISHFICRLAYCRNEELRKWFITQETRLFSIRLSDFNPLIIK
jgi:DNA primase large subunit